MDWRTYWSKSGLRYKLYSIKRGFIKTRSLVSGKLEKSRCS